MTQATLEIPLTHLVIRSGEAPMDWTHVEALLEGLVIDLRPIYVSPVEYPYYRILNGRHRFVAAMVRGDETLMATLIESD